MGGPCTLGSTATAPACTDNFQVAPFTYNGKLWQSVEQCYQVSDRRAAADMFVAMSVNIASQAQKFLDPPLGALVEAIRSIQKQPVRLCCYFLVCINSLIV